MNLITKNLLVSSEPVPRPPVTPLDLEFGWSSVRRGLHTILLGYGVTIGMGLFAVVLAILVLSPAIQAKEFGDVVDAALVLYAGIGILFLMGVLSLALIVKGKICCLLSAPERCGARWMMFLSALCVVLGPALNTTARFVGASPKRPPVAAGRNADAVVEARIALREVGQSLLAHDARAYISLAGDVGSLMSGVFFVLFLRAVARCFDDSIRMRIAELYLLLVGLLFASTLYLFLQPTEFLSHPEWILALGGGWVVAGLWYIALLISTSTCIGEGLARRRSPLEV
jgi:hypothetical protein